MAAYTRSGMPTDSQSYALLATINSPKMSTLRSLVLARDADTYWMD